MDELVKMVAQKTGLSNDMAKTAVMTVADFLKKKLPGPIAAQVDSVLMGGGMGMGGKMGGMGSMDPMGGMMGKK